jgi:hypothetical protein
LKKAPIDVDINHSNFDELYTGLPMDILVSEEVIEPSKKTLKKARSFSDYGMRELQENSQNMEPLNNQKSLTIIIEDQVPKTS